MCKLQRCRNAGNMIFIRHCVISDHVWHTLLKTNVDGLVSIHLLWWICDSEVLVWIYSAFQHLDSTWIQVNLAVACILDQPVFYFHLWFPSVSVVLHCLMLYTLKSICKELILSFTRKDSLCSIHCPWVSCLILKML